MPTMRRSTRASKAPLPEVAEDKEETGKWSGTSSPLSSLSTPASTTLGATTEQNKTQQAGQQRRKSRRLTRTGGVSGQQEVDEDDDSVGELLTGAARVIQEQVNGNEDDGELRNKRKTQVLLASRKRKHDEDDEDDNEGDKESGEEVQDEPQEGAVKWWPGKRGRPPKAVSDTRRLTMTPQPKASRLQGSRRLNNMLEAGDDNEPDSDASALETPTKRPTRMSIQSDMPSHSRIGHGDDEYPASSSDEEEEVDAEGESKIDHLGYLQGNREFICPVVRSPFRRNQNRQYILTMDCCRFTGARDSYMLFKQHPRMRRVETTQKERDMLAESKMIPKVTRFRPIAMITARTAFREFGALIVKNGRYIVDDYWVSMRKKEAKYPEGTLVANMSVYHSVMAAHAAGVTPSSTRKARRITTPHRSNSNDNGAGAAGYNGGISSRPGTPGARGPAVGSPAMVVNSWVQIEAQQRMQRQQIGSTSNPTASGLSGALTMASALQQQQQQGASAGQVQPMQLLLSDNVDSAADTDEPSCSSNNNNGARVVLGKPMFGKSRSAETADAVFEPVVSAHRTYFADDRGFLDGIPLVHSLAGSWPRTTSLSSKLKQKSAIAAIGSPTVEPGDETSGPMAFASGKLVREFNSSLRFWREDNGCTWVDPHTGIRQVPGNLQPTVARVEKLSMGDPGLRMRGGRTKIDSLVSFADYGLGFDGMAVDPVVRARRVNAVVAADRESYPLALLPGQYQDSFPVHRTRFGQTQNQAMQSYLLLWMHHWNVHQQQKQHHRMGILKAIKGNGNNSGSSGAASK
ncbi:hypothetical protein J3B02_003588 [Coemansia erecta]|nr:hypothetical protein J3B02_003588 [Coemansia erecta]